MTKRYSHDMVLCISHHFANHHRKKLFPILLVLLTTETPLHGKADLLTVGLCQVKSRHKRRNKKQNADHSICHHVFSIHVLLELRYISIIAIAELQYWVLGTAFARRVQTRK